MSQVRNKTLLTAVMRHDFDGNDILICVCRTPMRAEELVGEYAQIFEDRGVSPEESYFYATGTIFYDQ